MLLGSEKAARRADSFHPDLAHPRIFLDRDFGRLLAAMSRDGSSPAIRSINADPWPRLAA